MQYLLWWKKVWPTQYIFPKTKPCMQLKKLCKTVDNCTVLWLTTDLICHSFINPSKNGCCLLCRKAYDHSQYYCTNWTSSAQLYFNIPRKRILKILVKKKKKLSSNTKKWANSFNYDWNFVLKLKFSLRQAWITQFKCVIHEL